MKKTIFLVFTLSFFFLVNSLIFLSSPKPVSAATACTISPNAIAPGGTITVNHGGFAPDESIRLFGSKMQTEIAKTQDSTGFLVPQTVQIPVMAPEANDYFIVIVTRFPITSTTCTGGPLKVIAGLGSTSGTCSSFLDCLTGIASPTNQFSENGLVGAVITTILPIIYVFLGFITIIVIVISGIQFIASNGNPDAAASARGRLTYAIIGLIVIILAFAITQIVNSIFLKAPGF